MEVNVFEPDSYLRRVNLPGTVKPTEDGLEALHRAQLGTIPFENLDIILGRGISLGPADIFSKLVHKPRGGYCFELNGLYLMALQFFGFTARPLLARVHRNGTPMGRGHQLALVTIQGRDWISDVGFGSMNIPAPLPLETGYIATLDGHKLRLNDREPFGIMLQILKGDTWHDLYSFDLGYVCQGDIAYGNHFTSTHPDSFFTFARVAALPSPGGRITLFNRLLKKTGTGTEEVNELPEGQAYLDALKRHFGIELDVPYETLSPLQEQKAMERGIAF